MQPLDAVPWAELEHAYGAAVDVPDWIRALAASGADAEEAAFELAAALLHQGTYYPATPVAVPYLVDALREPDAARADILYLLAALSGAHMHDAEPAFDPYAFRSDNGDADYPEAQESIAAVRAGHAAYLPLLGDPDPRVRSAAAYLIVGCPEARDAARADLLARMGSEPDPLVRANQVFALGRLGVSSVELVPLRDDPAEVVRAAAAIELARLEPTAVADPESLVDAACLDLDSTVWGTELGVLAAAAMTRFAQVRPADAQTVLRAALGRRLAAGHRPIEHSEWMEGRTTERGRSHDQILRALVTVLTPLVFGDLTTRARLATRGELTEQQAELLRWSVDYHLHLPVRAVPWFDPEQMRRFLDAPDGPLERPLTVATNGVSETAPTWFWLCTLDDTSADGRRLAESVRTALREQRTPAELVALAQDACTGSYGADGPHRILALKELIDPSSSTVEEDLSAWAHNLGEKPHGDQAAFVVITLATLAQARGEVLDESYDPLIAAALGPEERDWLLESMPAKRRTSILAQMTSGYFLRRLLPFGDTDEVARRVVSALATQPPGDTVANLQRGERLRALGPAAAVPLRAALQGDVADPVLFADVLAEIESRSHHVVSIALTEHGLALRLSTPDGQSLTDVTVPRHPKHDDLEPLVAALPEPAGVRLKLDADGDIDHSTMYRLQRLFAEFPVRSVSAGGSTLHRRTQI